MVLNVSLRVVYILGLYFVACVHCAFCYAFFVFTHICASRKCESLIIAIKLWHLWDLTVPADLFRRNLLLLSSRSRVFFRRNKVNVLKISVVRWGKIVRLPPTPQNSPPNSNWRKLKCSWRMKPLQLCGARATCVRSCCVKCQSKWASSDTPSGWQLWHFRSAELYMEYLAG